MHKDHPNFIAELEAEFGFHNMLGYHLTRWEPGLAEMTLQLGPQHMNRSGVMHGGLVTTLIDSSFGYAVCYCDVPGHIKRCVTLSLTTSYVGQAGEGEIVRAIGRVRGGGRRVLSCSGELINQAGDVLAIGEGVYRYRSGFDRETSAPADF